MDSKKLFHDSYKNKRVFVTGHTGFKGAWLTQWLLELGAKVAGYSLYVPSKPSLFEILELSNQITDFRADITDFNSLQNAVQEFQPEVIFHLAAQPIVSESYNHPQKTFFVNLMGMVNVLESLRHIKSIQAGVFITSDKCYENVEWEYGYRESDKLGGKDPYSASKACAEIAFSSYVRSFFSNTQAYFSTTRAGNVIGGGDWAKDRIVPDCMQAWSQNEDVFIRNPYATRPWQHVLEPLSGYLHLGSQLLQKQENLHGEAFNFGPSAEANYSVESLIQLIVKEWGNLSYKSDISNVFKNMKEAGLLKLSCDKSLKYLSWTPTLSFEETAHFTSLWYKNFYSNKINMKEYTKNQLNEYSNLSNERQKIWIAH